MVDGLVAAALIELEQRQSAPSAPHRALLAASDRLLDELEGLNLAGVVRPPTPVATATSRLFARIGVRPEGLDTVQEVLDAVFLAQESILVAVRREVLVRSRYLARGAEGSPKNRELRPYW
ncbi:MAG: hypothetical protein ACRDYD_04835 [Acidimicrobiales bacterium]